MPPQATMTMTTMPANESAAWITIRLTEWDHIDPSEDPRLKGLSFSNNAALASAADKLRHRILIRERRDGIEIRSTSYVGLLEFDCLRIVITPKIDAMPLTLLLRYTYGIGKLSLLERTEIPLSQDGIQDLLISILASEVEQLLRQGLSRRYVRQAGKLESPRGRIDISSIARSGGIHEPRLPCIYDERSFEWHLNRVILAGLKSALRMVRDPELLRRIRRLATEFGELCSDMPLDSVAIDTALRGLTRQTDIYFPALTAIRLLHETLGVDTIGGTSHAKGPGFLFDMNMFFQRLVSKFLHENLRDAHIEDESAIRGMLSYGRDANPKRRRAPSPRPDFALYSKGKLETYLDAKYRDTWIKKLPADWLYQLSIYALASPSTVSVLLYASMSDSAIDQRIDICPPTVHSQKNNAAVLIRPVGLSHLCSLIQFGSPAERTAFAEQLVSTATYSSASAFTCATTLRPSADRL
jgi:5-methylcytosine-specific restriction enzyme subunit McrC